MRTWVANVLLGADVYTELDTELDTSLGPPTLSNLLGNRYIAARAPNPATNNAMIQAQNVHNVSANRAMMIMVIMMIMMIMMMMIHHHHHHHHHHHQQH